MEIVGTTEVARMLGVSRQRVLQLAARPGFPEPLGRLPKGNVWRKDDVKSWAAEKGREVRDD